MITLVEIDAGNLSGFQKDIMKIERSSFPSPWSLRAFWEEVRNPLAYFLGMKFSDRFAGYACFWMFCSELHLLNFAVRGEFRGQGLGSYLLKVIIDNAVERKVEKAWLEVRPSNTPARKLYKKAGFKEIARRPRYYSDTDEDAIVMSLGLDEEFLNHIEPLQDSC